MARLLVIAPLMDVPTATSYDTAVSLAEWARQQGHDVNVLGSLKAIRPIMVYQMLKKQPDLVSYFGHGTENSLTGQLLFYSLVDTSSAAIFKEKIVHTMACLSAIDLGRAAVEAGAKAYFGANHYLMAAFPEPEHNYYGDWKDYMTVIPKALLTGSTTGEAFRMYQNRATDYITLYQRNLAEWGNADWYVQSTTTNRDRYELLGDRTMRIGNVSFYGDKGRMPVRGPFSTSSSLKQTVLAALVGFSPALLLAAPLALKVADTQLKKRGYVEE